MKKENRTYVDGYLVNYSSGTGYPTIWVNDKNTLVHRYVWEKHHGTIPDGYQIHHKDRDRTNFNLDNLELVDNREHHRRHALENKLGHSNKGKPKLHASGFCGKPKKIVAFKNGECMVFPSVAQAARYFNTSVGSICRVLSGKRQTNYGWRFIYAEG